MQTASLAYGEGFPIKGNISSTYNQLTTVTAAMYKGTATSGTASIEASDSVSGNYYSPASSFFHS